jgi:hypothetical protein
VEARERIVLFAPKNDVLLKKTGKEALMSKIGGLISRRKILQFGLLGTILGLGKRAGWAGIQNGHGRGGKNPKNMNDLQNRCAQIIRRYGGELGPVSSTCEEK